MTEPYKYVSFSEAYTKIYSDRLPKQYKEKRDEKMEKRQDQTMQEETPKPQPEENPTDNKRLIYVLGKLIENGHVDAEVVKELIEESKDWRPEGLKVSQEANDKKPKKPFDPDARIKQRAELMKKAPPSKMPSMDDLTKPRAGSSD